MTHTARLRLLLGAILLCSLIVAGTLAAGVLCLRGIVRVPPIARESSWWFVYGATPANQARVGYGALLALLAVGLSFALRLRAHFARTAEPQAFFFFFFLCSLSLEALRVPAVLLSGGAAVAPLLLSRFVYAGRLFGTLCLFGVSLFSLEVQYSRFGTLLGVAAILALMFGYTVPLDSSMFLSSGLYRLGDERGAAIIFFAMYLFIVANPAVAALREQSVEPLACAVALLLVLLGREMLQFAATIVTSAAGLAALAGGCILMAARLRRAAPAL